MHEWINGRAALNRTHELISKVVDPDDTTLSSFLNIYFLLSFKKKNLLNLFSDPRGGGSVGTSVRGPIATYILFLFFFFSWEGIFNYV